MERFDIGGVEVRLRITDGSAYKYRLLLTENAVTLNAPNFVGKTAAIKKASEIVREGLASERLNDLHDGGFIKLFGEKVPLVVYDAEVCSIAMYANKVYLGVVNGRIGYHARRTVEGFYERRLFEKLKERVPAMENLVGIKCVGWKINKMYSAWGNCRFDKKEINFSVNLAAQPPECIDMVIVHELGHILYPDHGADFHAYMDKYVPNNASIKAKMVL